MLVRLDDELTKCSICFTKFSSDRDNEDPEIRKLLPVLSSSQRCDHWFCHGCILREQQRVAEENNGRVPKWIKCMHCREKTSFNPAEPKYHRLLINLLTKSKKKKGDGLTDEQRKEKELKKKMYEDMNNFLSAWLLRPEYVHANPIAAATPTAEAKEWMAKHLGVDRARIDSWFYRRKTKLKKEHMPNNSVQAFNNSSAGSVSLPQQVQQQPKVQTVPASTSTIAKNVVPTSQNQFAMNPNLNLHSNHQRPQNQTALTASTQVSMSINQQLPSNGQSQVAVGEEASAKSSSNCAPVSKQSGLSDEAKQ